MQLLLDHVMLICLEWILPVLKHFLHRGEFQSCVVISHIFLKIFVNTWVERKSISELKNHLVQHLFSKLRVVIKGCQSTSCDQVLSRQGVACEIWVFWSGFLWVFLDVIQIFCLQRNCQELRRFTLNCKIFAKRFDFYIVIFQNWGEFLFHKANILLLTAFDYRFIWLRLLILSQSVRKVFWFSFLHKYVKGE